MKDVSRLRKTIGELQEERGRIEEGLFYPYPMAPYALVESYARCGNKRCRCQKGKPHGPYWYLTQHWAGKTRNIYVPREKVEQIAALARRYKEYEGALTKLRGIHAEMMGLLKRIEESRFVPASKLSLRKSGGKRRRHRR